MRYLVYALGLTATLIAVFGKTTRPDRSGPAALTPVGLLAVAMAAAVFAISVLGTCRDQRALLRMQHVRTAPSSIAAAAADR